MREPYGLGDNSDKYAGLSAGENSQRGTMPAFVRRRKAEKTVRILMTVVITMAVVLAMIISLALSTNSVNLSSQAADLEPSSATRVSKTFNRESAENKKKSSRQKKHKQQQNSRKGSSSGANTGQNNKTNEGNSSTSSSRNFSGSRNYRGQTLPRSIAKTVPNNAVLVSPNLAAAPNGTVYNVMTGKKVTVPAYFGTAARPADPLAKTGGQSFKPISIAVLRQEEKKDSHDTSQFAPGSVNQSSSSSRGTVTSALAVRTPQTQASHVHTVSLPGNSYGAHWGTYQGSPAFYGRTGSLFAQQAKGVVDVSQWQGSINWAAVKKAGVEGAIIRIGYGVGNADSKALYNISECKRLGIPFGLYIYSYAYNTTFAYNEGTSVANLLKKYGVSAKDLTYPVYYDLEAWSWTGHTRPTSPAVYQSIVNSWYSSMEAAGFSRSKLGVYSYTSYLNTSLNDASIHQKTSWVAQYSGNMGFTNWTSNFRGWQYTSQGSISGISGTVDLNAFGYKTRVNSAGGSSSSSSPKKDTKTTKDNSTNSNYNRGINLSELPLVTIPNGRYYINVKHADTMSLDINGGSLRNGQALQIYQWNNSTAQQFIFTRQADRSYVITNVNSGKAIDVSGSRTADKTKIQQWSRNGAKAQKWFIRSSGDGYYLQSALGNWVLDMANGSVKNYTSVRLFTPNGTNAQRFQLASVATLPMGTALRISSVVNPSQVLDIPGGSKNNSARLELYKWLGGSAQLFTLAQVGNGVYTITNINSGRLIDVSGNSFSNGAKVQQYQATGSQAQHWQVRVSGTGSSTSSTPYSPAVRYSFVGSGSGKFLDLPSGKAVNLAKLQIWQSTGTSAQQWTLSQAQTTDALSYNHRADLPDGTYTFGSGINSSYKMDVSGGSRKAGANVQLWKSNNMMPQRWMVTHDSHGYIHLTNVQSGLRLDVQAGSSVKGTNVRQWSANNAAAQKWIAVRNSNGSFTLYSAVNPSGSAPASRVLDVRNGVAAGKSNVQLWAANGTKAQQWWAVKKY